MNTIAKATVGEGNDSFYWMLSALVVVLVGLLIWAAWSGFEYYRWTSSEVRYVVQSGFKGAVCISLSTTGTPLAKSPDGPYEISIPMSGRVSISVNGLYNHWHRESAMFSSGQRLPIGSELPKEDVTSLAFFGMYRDKKDQMWFFVGKRDEWLQALHRPELQPGPLLNTTDNSIDEAIARPE